MALVKVSSNQIKTIGSASHLIASNISKLILQCSGSSLFFFKIFAFFKLFLVLFEISPNKAPVTLFLLHYKNPRLTTLQLGRMRKGTLLGGSQGAGGGGGDNLYWGRIVRK